MTCSLHSSFVHTMYTQTGRQREQVLFFWKTEIGEAGTQIQSSDHPVPITLHLSLAYLVPGFSSVSLKKNMPWELRIWVLFGVSLRTLVWETATQELWIPCSEEVGKKPGYVGICWLGYTQSSLRLGKKNIAYHMEQTCQDNDSSAFLCMERS